MNFVKKNCIFLTHFHFAFCLICILLHLHYVSFAIVTFAFCLICVLLKLHYVSLEFCYICILSPLHFVTIRLTTVGLSKHKIFCRFMFILHSKTKSITNSCPIITLITSTWLFHMEATFHPAPLFFFAPRIPCLDPS